MTLLNPFNLAVLKGGAGGALIQGLLQQPPGHHGPLLVKTGPAALSVRAGTLLGVGGRLVSFAVDTPVAMPALVAGSDYAVWVSAEGVATASSNFVAAPGAGDWRRLGGFHCAPGGNAPAQAGGDSTPSINEYSIWDLKWRPACRDPRGMTLVAGNFWADIYLLGVNHTVGGTSVFGATIADGSAPPKVPPNFGGDGAVAYPNCNWWVASEVMAAHGKRLPNYAEFAALAFGTTEATPVTGSTDPVTTKLDAAHTSRWGVMQASGNMWCWGRDQGGGQQAASWAANTGGRGSTYLLPNAVLFGCYWSSGSDCGSRASYWSYSPAFSGNGVGARGVCDHLDLA